MRFIAILLLAVVFAGCATVGYSNRGGKKIIEVSNSGWYLFNIIPLVSGNPDKLNSCSPIFFSKTATLENNIKILNDVVSRAGASGVMTLKSSWDDESMFVILCKRHVIHTSAELVFDKSIKQGSNRNAN